ncbi:MAG TPA: cbb3-type cytochrome c oxidase N-terminal domain-containing protein [Opitutaceae bacterium]|nr:cbb3-type cytochrome c oxidase N-terminal domain-containing protein [Opitutaceae bacterium]
MSEPVPPPSPPEDAFRPHSYDGIREYDKRLPNWWLWTFYVTIIFSIVYWFYYFTSGVGPDDRTALTRELARIETAKLEAVATLSDDALWRMSRNGSFVASGRATFETTCATCHNLKLTGGIGPNLLDQEWIHGGKPTEIFHTVTTGVPAKGMPTWGPVLGTKKITEVVAYILSHHTPGEPVVIVPSPVPGGAPPAP